MKKLIASLLAAIGISGMASAQPTETTPPEMSADLRAMVFSMSPQDIGITKENYPHEVWGIVMETGLGPGCYTLVSLADGGTSLYYSTGGGVIGAGEHATVKRASEEFLDVANNSLATAHPTTAHPSPSTGETIFYFLTFNGLQEYKALEADLGEGHDRLSKLFYAGQNVITEIRKLNPH